MTDQHQDIFETLGAYALGAVPDGERARVAAHLEDCPICAEDATSLMRAASNLVADVPVLDPPPALRDRIMAVVESEAALLQATSPEPARQRRRISFPAPALRW